MNMKIPFISPFLFALFLQACTPVEFVRDPKDLGPKKVLIEQENAARRQQDSLIHEGEKSARIAIVSHSTLNVKYIDIAIANQKKYAKKHGYDYIFRNNVISEDFLDPWAESKVFQLGLFWQKIKTVQDAIDDGYKWVFWIDPDVLFTNFDKRIEDIVAEHGKNGEEFLISHENFAFVNTGIFLVHQSEWSKEMFRKIAKLHQFYKNEYIPEQLAVQDFVLGFADVDMNGIMRIVPHSERKYHQKPVPKAKILPQRVLNSFYGGNFWLPGASNESAVWQPGDFVAHYAVRMSAKEKEMRALVECFKKECGEDYENQAKCMMRCS